MSTRGMMGDRRGIVAVVTLDRDRVLPSGPAVFVARDRDEQERVALLLGRILDAMSHDLGNGCLIVVRH